MSIFSILELENEVQIGDKTRLHASKSFNTRNSIEINSITIKPELSASAIECFHPDYVERYIDWAYTNTSIDVDSNNNDIIFSESGGTDISTTLTAGTYTISQYITHVAARMTLAGTQTYTGSYANNKATISATTSFEIKSCSVQEQLHIELEDSGTIVISKFIEYGQKIVTLVCTNADAESDTKYFYIKVYSEDGDYLFSNDSDLVAHEPDILKWVPDGRASFKNIHRRSQKLIMQWIDENGYTDINGKKYTKRDLVDVDEVKQWSTFMTLRMIFTGLSNQLDDVFDRKAREALDLENSARKRCVLRIDFDKNGQIDDNENLWIGSGSLFRR